MPFNYRLYMQTPEREHFYYNALACALHANYDKLKARIRRHHTWEKAWRRHERTLFDSIFPDKEWEKLTSHGVRLILSGDKEYPKLLREIPSPPFGIYVRGELAGPEKCALAIVGTRKATTSGKISASRFAAELASAGLSVVSGLAFGIDAASHRGALDAGGHTVAVLAHGLDHVHPNHNEMLARRILASGGALVSEYPLCTPAMPHQFIARNRIVSGLSLGTLVIEAPERSGALGTARFALDQNRDVFVLPGPASAANFIGSHLLIRSGAELIFETEHILDSLNIPHDANSRNCAPSLFASTPEMDSIYSLLRTCGEALSIDKISELTNLKIQQVVCSINMLIIAKQAHEDRGGYRALIK